MKYIKPVFQVQAILIAILAHFVAHSSQAVSISLSINESYTHSLKNEAKERTQELLNLMHITKGEWASIKKTASIFQESDEEDYYTSSRPLPDAYKLSAIQVFSKPYYREAFGVKSFEDKGYYLKIHRHRNAPISIKRGSTQRCPYNACALDDTIWIVPDFMMNMEYQSPTVFESIIAHEAAHLLHKDTDTRLYFEAAYDYGYRRMTRAERKKVHKLLQQWDHFVEKRADLTASLLDFSYASAQRELFRRACHNPYHSSDDDHPTAHQRFAYLDDIHTALQQECSVIKLTQTDHSESLFGSILGFFAGMFAS